MRTAALVGALAVSALTSGCSQVVDELTGTDAAQAAPVAPILETTGHGVVEGMVSVAVRNPSDRTLRQAQAVVRVLDARGRVIASSLEKGEAGCCTVVDLAPGAVYGFYLDIGSAAERAADVSVTYRNVSWAAAGSSEGSTPVSARALALEDGPRGAVVVAELTSPDQRDQVGVQAFLTDANGDFLAVVSGRWSCLEPGTRQIRMQLFHPVPAGSRVESIHVQPVEAASTSRPVTCDGSDRR